jgi:DNA-binding LacI/PurR family transcriptional regulator
MTNARPLYIQIAETLKKEILAGAVKPLERLGSQREFCARFKVSPITVEWALRKLDADGVITRVRGCGTFVAGDILKRKVKTRRIGVVGHLDTDWEANVYVRTLYHAVQVEAQNSGVLIRFYERESDYADLLDQEEVDGLMILAPMQSTVEQLRLLDPARHHYVIVAGDWGVTPCVLSDNRKGVTAALKHLEALGHTRIGLITDLLESSDVRQRLQAYLDFHQARHWPVVDRYLMHRPDYTIQGADEARVYQHFFGGRRPPTALLALGSNYAEDVIRLLRARGVRVPEEVSVVGCDLPPHNRDLQRELTALVQPLSRMGSRALHVLDQKMDKLRIRDRLLLAPRLQIGSTTGPAPRAAASSR